MSIGETGMEFSYLRRGDAGEIAKQSEQMCYIAALIPHANRRMMPVAGRSGDMNF